MRADQVEQLKQLRTIERALGTKAQNVAAKHARRVEALTAAIDEYAPPATEAGDEE